MTLSAESISLGLRLENRLLWMAYDVPLDGIPGQPGDVVDIKFVHDLLAVFLNRLNADSQFGSDPFVGETLGDELEYLHLAGC